MSARTDEVDYEHECLSPFYNTAGAAPAVAKMSWNRQLPPSAYPHTYDTLIPPLYHLARSESELEGLIPVPRRVELGSRGPGDTHVVDRDLTARDRFGPLPDHEVFYLQVGGWIGSWDVNMRFRHLDKLLRRRSRSRYSSAAGGVGPGVGRFHDR